VDYLSLVNRIDELYRSVVEDPGRWNEAAFADWAEDVFSSSDGIGKAEARELRRCLRAAGKLQAFWMVDDATRPPDAGDWRTRVDIGLGPAAWRPPLALAQIGLERVPSAELYEEVSTRFREVHSEVWMGGINYESWRSGRDPTKWGGE